MWCCKIKLDWPRDIKVKSYGMSEETSIRNAQLLAVHHLKINGFVDSSNRFLFPSKRIFKTVLHSYRERLIKQPDFKLYSDASPFGFGAFLLKSNDTNAPVQYLCSRFPHDFMEQLAQIYRNGRKWQDLGTSFRKIVLQKFFMCNN